MGRFPYRFKTNKNNASSSDSRNDNPSQEHEEFDTVLRLRPPRNNKRVKVVFDGCFYARCVDLATYNGYDDLVSLARVMFNSTYELLWPNVDVRSEDGYVLTYYDKDDDWMMVGDVPYKMFLEVVKDLRICKRVDAYNCRINF